MHFYENMPSQAHLEASLKCVTWYVVTSQQNVILLTDSIILITYFTTDQNTHEFLD